MAWYRMYFVDRLQQVRWPYDLHAENDAHALILAHASQDACADVQIAVELWQGARRIAGTSNRRPEAIRANWEELPVDRQEALLQIEEAILHSGTMIARSRRLRERLNSLRDEIAHKKDAAAGSTLSPEEAVRPSTHSALLH